MTRSRGYLSPGVTLNQSHPRMEALFHDLHSKTVFAFDSTKKPKLVSSLFILMFPEHFILVDPQVKS